MEMSEELREYDALVLLAIILICATFFLFMWLGAVLRELSLLLSP